MIFETISAAPRGSILGQSYLMFSLKYLAQKQESDNEMCWSQKLWAVVIMEEQWVTLRAGGSKKHEIRQFTMQSHALRD